MWKKKNVLNMYTVYVSSAATPSNTTTAVTEE